MAVPLTYYYNWIFWINFSTYWLYFIIKYLMALLWVSLYVAEKDKRCCCRESEKCTNCLKGLTKVILCLIRRPVLLVFGKELAMETHVYHDDDRIHVNTLSLRDRRLSYASTAVFFVLIVSFVLLTVGSTLNLTLFSVTHICSEDPKIDCYPQLIQGADDTGLNISIDEPILDCTFWNSEGVSERVTFACYRFIFNADLFFAVLGGLTAFCVTATKLTTEICLFLGKKLKQCECSICGLGTRFICATVAFFVEVIALILAMVFGGTGSMVDKENDSIALVFLATHITEILIVLGATATLLWIPWESLSKKGEEEEGGGEEGGREQGGGEEGGGDS